MDQVSNQAIRIHYDGKGERIKSHQMKASYVSESIKGFDILYREAYREANKIYKSKIKTEILLDGGFQEGSLFWWLKLFSSESESQQSLIRNNKSNSVINSVNFIINLLKKMDLRTTEIVIRYTPDGYEVEIDNERVVLDELQCAILTNPKIRSAISNITKPLEDDEIDSLTIENSSTSIEKIKITKEERNNLIIKRNHKHIIEEGKIAGFYYIDTLSYNPKSKWKLIEKDNPSQSISVSIVDAKFLMGVSNNKEKFAKDDLLEVEGTWYREKTTLTGNVTSIYTITEVKDHIPVEEKQWKLL